ncbi:MAG: cyclic nucleotide-binding domain-containing protein [Magnetococcales bacterium]|nr:cyclic nucleotide-binding domain-containing protein [Magnetococcales bacterium]
MSVSEPVFRLLGTLPLFNTFNEREKRRIASLDHIFMRFSSNEIIFKEGATDQSFHILISGSVRITRNDLPNKALAHLSPGAIFGEIAFLTGRRRGTNVIANDSVITMKLDHQTLHRMNPTLREGIKNQLIELLANRVNQLNDSLIKRAKVDGSAYPVND